ncbi:hypothetical protein APSETT444_007726 [Aspergillus pseudonomiae]
MAKTSRTVTNKSLTRKSDDRQSTSGAPQIPRRTMETVEAGKFRHPWEESSKAGEMKSIRVSVEQRLAQRLLENGSRGTLSMAE